MFPVTVAMSTWRIVWLCLAIAVGFFAAPRPAAAQVFWNSSTNASWNSGPSWLGSVIPGAGSLAAFDTTAASLTNVTLDANQTVAGVLFSNLAVPLTISSGTGTNTLNLGVLGIDMNTPNANVIISAGVNLSSSQTWAVGTGFNLSTGTIGLNAPSADVTLTLAGAGTKTLTGGINTNGVARRLTIGGSTQVLTLSGSQTFSINQGQSSNLTVQSAISSGTNTLTVNPVNAATSRSDVILSGTLTGSGGLSKTGSGVLFIGSGVTDTSGNSLSGNLNVSDGWLILNKGNDTLAGVFSNINLSGSAHLRFSMTGTGGNNQLPSTVNLTLTGSSGFNTTRINTDATLIDEAGNFNQTFNTISHGSTGTWSSGAGDVIVTNAFNVTSTGGVAIDSGGLLQATSINFDAGSSVNLTGNSNTRQSVIRVGSGGLTTRRNLGINVGVAVGAQGSRIELGGTLTMPATGTVTILPGGTGSGDVRRLELRSPTRIIDVTDAAGILEIGVRITDGTGTGGIVKNGPGTLSLSGSGVNVSTFTGNLQINAGTLRYNAADVIPDTADIILNGGTFRTGAGTGFSDTVSGLAVSASSAITLGTGVHTLTFANLDSFDAGRTLTINGYTGSQGGPGSQGRIIFTDASAFTPSILAQINFTGYPPGAMIAAGNELVPVPEPTGLLAVALAGLGGAWWRRSRRVASTMLA